VLLGWAGGLLLESALFANAATALEELDDLLQTEGDDEADADGDEVEEDGDRLLERWRYGTR